MGKKAPPAAAPPAAKKGGEAPPKKKALSSEIDDIFSSKPKPAAAPAAAQGLGVASPPISKAVQWVKKAKKKGGGAVPPGEGVEVLEHKEAAPQQEPEGDSKGGKKFGIEDDELMSSLLGTGPRGTTEEGYRIYKEDELRMDKGGDTDLCPFDCACCY